MSPMSGLLSTHENRCKAQVQTPFSCFSSCPIRQILGKLLPRTGIFALDSAGLNCVLNQVTNLRALPVVEPEAPAQARVGERLARQMFQHSVLIAGLDPLNLRHFDKGA